MVDRDQLRAVGEGALDLHLLEHLRHAVHDVVPLEDGDAEGHQFGDAPAVADALEDLGGDEGQRLGIVQLEAPPPPPARHLGGGEDQQLVLLSGCQVHGRMILCQTVRCCLTTSWRSSEVEPLATIAPLRMMA